MTRSVQPGMTWRVSFPAAVLPVIALIQLMSGGTACISYVGVLREVAHGPAGGQLEAEISRLRQES